MPPNLFWLWWPIVAEFLRLAIAFLIVVCLLTGCVVGIVTHKAPVPCTAGYVKIDGFCVVGYKPERR